ncbi:MAG: FecR domain-containing protein [Chitinophagaceae bacterium]|nr:FecR domain-containing protein [Chitinophagaceae bacterium]
MENFRLFVTLFNKYLDNRCPPEETEYLFGLMQSDEYQRAANEMIESRLQRNPGINDDPILREKLNARLKSILTAPDHAPAPVRRIHTWKWIAAAGIVLAAFISIYRLVTPAVPGKTDLPANEPLAAASLTGYTRYITLPDGSSVVLHAGSKLEYPNKFTGKTREVALSGEAYFDVSHNPEQPFIIHTGKIKTTVLGTAFNIKSDEKQVTVSVTRGKVRVEDETKVLAVLTPDQQVQYNVTEAAIAHHTVNASSIVTGWTKENMVFNGITFKEIGKILSQRYGVPVRFETEGLEKCKIRASFSGTEALDHVAAVLSAIRNGSFEQLPDGTIVFTGEGCD